MTKEKINWRSFDDRDGVINRQWNFPATPVFYIIDHEGVIRRKWMGKPSERSVDTALEKLIRKAKGRAAPQ
jgi:peroxiredoxin